MGVITYADNTIKRALQKGGNMNTQLWQRVANALSDTPSKQPVTNAGHVDSQPENGEKANSKAGITSGFKQKQKGNPNRSYPVSVINKAQAKIG